VTYEPSTEQQAVITTTARVAVVIGGAGSGKTTTAAAAASRRLHNQEVLRSNARDQAAFGTACALLPLKRVLFVSFSRTA